MELKLSKEVLGNSEDCDSVVPTSGKDVHIYLFHAAASFSQNTVVKLVWDFGEAGEEVIWTIKGESKMPFEHTIPAADVDGVKKLALCLENTGTGPAFLSGFCEYRELG